MLSMKIFDRKRSFSDLSVYSGFLYWELAHSFDNWLQPPPGQSYRRWIPIFSELLSNATDIRFAARSLFVAHAIRCWDKLHSAGAVIVPTLQDVFNSLQQAKYPMMSNLSRYRETILHRLHGVLDVFGEQVCSRQRLNWNAFMSTDCAIALDGIPTDMQNLFISVMTGKIINYRIANDLRSDTCEVLIVFDEAATIFRKRQEESDGVFLLTDYLAQAREYGVGFVIGTQGLSNLADSVLANTATKILAGGFGLGKDYDVFASSTGMTAEQREFIKGFTQPGVAFVKDPRWPTPFQCYVPQITR